MLVREWMTCPVITVSPKTSVLNARRLLQLHGFRHLPVTTGDRVVGMVSDRDIRVTDTALARSLASLESDLLTGRYRRVESVMSSPVHTVAPNAPIAVAAELMVRHHIGALPVVGPEGLVGIIGLTDCVRALLGSTAGARTPTSDDGIDLHLDVDAPVPMGAGDERPGRPDGKPVALVVDADATSRLRIRNDLTAKGYSVNTCPGPSGGAFCPAVRDGDLPCARVPSHTALVVLDADSAPLAHFYERWLPHAEIRIGTPGDLLPA
jgi:CBS domain-containing protein